MTRPSDVEVLVVGGGPVGLVAALHAARAGFDVAVIEPRHAPIDKACGEGLMPAALAALRRLDIDPPGAELAGIAYCQGDTRAEHRFAGAAGRGVRRTALHATLSEHVAAAGIPVLTGRLESLAQDAAGVTVQAVGPGGATVEARPSDATAGAGPRSIRARWLIGCDGLHSNVRGLIGALARASSPRRRRFGLRRHFRVAPWSDLVEVHWGPMAEAYVTPVADDLVGVAVLGPQGTDFGDAVAALPSLAARLAGAPADGPVRGAGPLLQRTRTRVRGRVLLAGDASGYVDALTGEGLRVGFVQAEAAVRAISDGDPQTYEPAWRRATRDTRLLTSGLLVAARSPLRARIVPTAARAPGIYGAIVERLAR